MRKVQRMRKYACLGFTFLALTLAAPAWAQGGAPAVQESPEITAAAAAGKAAFDHGDSDLAGNNNADAAEDYRQAAAAYQQAAILSKNPAYAANLVAALEREALAFADKALVEEAAGQYALAITDQQAALVCYQQEGNLQLSDDTDVMIKMTALDMERYKAELANQPPP